MDWSKFQQALVRAVSFQEVDPAQEADPIARLKHYYKIYSQTKGDEVFKTFEIGAPLIFHFIVINTTTVEVVLCSLTKLHPYTEKARRIKTRHFTLHFDLWP